MISQHNLLATALWSSLAAIALLVWPSVVDAATLSTPVSQESLSASKDQHHEETPSASTGGMAPANAVALFAKGDYAASMVEYREALRLHPDFAEAHHGLGYALFSQGEVDAAIVEYRTTLALRPDHAMAHGSLGLALEAKGDSDGAIEEYRETIRLNHGLWMVHNNLASP